MCHPGLRDDKCAENRHFCRKASLELEEFLSAGEPPVCVGWAPMLASCPYQATFIAVRCLKNLGLRGIILSGAPRPNGMPRLQSAEEREVADYMSTRVLFIDAAPCEQLFRRCVAVLHPGCGKATKSALLAGVPSVISPCFRNEVHNAEAVEGLGCGIAVPTLHEVSNSRLHSALALACSDLGMRQACRRQSALMIAGGSATGGVLGTIKGISSPKLRQRRRKTQMVQVMAGAKKRPEEEDGCVCRVVKLWFAVVGLQQWFPTTLVRSF